MKVKPSLAALFVSFERARSNRDMGDHDDDVRISRAGIDKEDR